MKRSIWMKLALAAAIAVVPAAQALACEMAFRLTGPDGKEMRILPGSTVALQKGADYTLAVEFIEDHRNCVIPPEETLFMLDGEKWRANKTTQALVLRSAISWTQNSKTLNTAVIPFTAGESGTAVLNISRVCPKAGYDESFTFAVK